MNKLLPSVSSISLNKIFCWVFVSVFSQLGQRDFGATGIVRTILCSHQERSLGGIKYRDDAIECPMLSAGSICLASSISDDLNAGSRIAAVSLQILYLEVLSRLILCCRMKTVHWIVVRKEKLYSGLLIVPFTSRPLAFMSSMA